MIMLISTTVYYNGSTKVFITWRRLTPLIFTTFGRVQMDILAPRVHIA